MILVPWLLIWAHDPRGCSQAALLQCCYRLFSFITWAKLTFSRYKYASQPREKSMFSSPQPEIPHPPPENTSWREAVGLGEKKKKSGSLAVYGAVREAARALHLTAPLSEPSLQPRTIPRCHLQLWDKWILSSNPRRRTGAVRKQHPPVAMYGQEQM